MANKHNNTSANLINNNTQNLTNASAAGGRYNGVIETMMVRDPKRTSSEQSSMSDNSIGRSSMRARMGSSFHAAQDDLNHSSSQQDEQQSFGSSIASYTSSTMFPSMLEPGFHSPWEILLDAKMVSPSPNRNYHQLLIMKKNEVRYRVWPISHNAHGAQKPSDNVMTFETFMQNDSLQDEIAKIFGENVPKYAKQLCSGRIDYVTRLEERPMVVLLQMLSYEDILQLALSGPRMADAIRNCEAFWKKAYCKYASEEVTRTTEEIAKRMSWRKLFMSASLHEKMRKNVASHKITAPK